MTNDKAALMLEKTQEILERLWSGDSSLMMSYIDDDFILTDPSYSIFLSGKNEVNDLLPQVISRTSVYIIDNKRFILAQNCGNACTVVGQYTLSGDNGEISGKMIQHCVFTWELANGKPVLKHIGVTRPETDSKSLDFPEEGKADSTLRKPQRLVITDNNEYTRFISRNDILYATSDGRNTLIRCANDDINARISISSFLKEVGSDFISIHRCYAVNVNHITMIKPYSVILSDGSELPIPVKRYAEIKQKITSILGNRNQG